MKRKPMLLNTAKVDGRLISCFFQKGSQKSIVFVHGFGASKETFLETFGHEKFQSFSMLATDLVGFGDSDKPNDFSYLMKDQAKILKKTIDRFGLDSFHLVSHSMGGIIGIELGEMIPNRVCSFVNAEGNITVEDCTITKRVAEMGAEYFMQSGFEELKRELAQEAEKRHSKILEDYLRSLAAATPKSLYRSALSTVHESNLGNLLTRFVNHPFYKCYIYGENNKGVFPAEELLRQNEIPLFYVSRSGHSMMKENPKEFYDIVLKIINQ